MKKDQEIIDILNELISKHARWGFWKCYYWMRNQGYTWNHKRVYRIYCAMNLNLKRKAKKRLPQREKQPIAVINKPNIMWAMDFMSDSLYQGKKIRTLNIIDEGVREALAIEVDSSLPALRVIRVLNQLKETRGLPQQIRIDNGPEFIAHALKSWAKDNQVKLIHIQPGKPTQNALVERFNRSFRNEILNAYLFESLEQVRELSWDWMQSYNLERPHAALGHIPPTLYRQQLEKSLHF